MYQRAAKSSTDDTAPDHEPAQVPRSAGDSFAAATSGGGSAVPYRADMEQAFGQDFSSVQAHLGQGDAMAELGAHAATRGETIAFGSASPDRELVAHELAHVVQGRQSGTGGGVHAKSIAPEAAAAEVEADAVAPRAAAGQRVQLTASLGAGIHLKAWKKGEFAMSIKGNPLYIKEVLDVSSPIEDEYLYRVKRAVSKPGKSDYFNVRGKKLVKPDKTATLTTFRTPGKHAARKRKHHEAHHQEHEHGHETRESFDETGEAIHGAAEGAEHVSQKAEDNEKHEIGGDHQGEVATGFATGASFLGAGASGITAITGLVGFVQNCKQIWTMDPETKGTDQLRLLYETAGNAGKTAVGATDTVARTGRGVAGVVSAAVDSDAAKTIMGAFGAVGAGVDTISNSVKTIRDGSKTVYGVVNGLRKTLAKSDKGGKAKADWRAVGEDALATLEDAAETAGSSIATINGFLSLVDKAGTLASAAPAVGAGLSIFVKLISITRELIDLIFRAIKLVRVSLDTHAMNKRKDDPKNSNAENEAYTLAAEVSRKRVKRQIMLLIAKDLVPMGADVISICGSVLEIVGVATSAAYGAGAVLVGIGAGVRAGAELTKVGAALTPTIAKAWRAQKQFGRNVHDDPNKKGMIATLYRKTGFEKKFNAEKSDDAKLDKYLHGVDCLFAMMRELPPFDHKSPDVKAQYKDVHRLIRATGVKPKALYAETDHGKAVHMLVEAMKQRE